MVKDKNIDLNKFFRSIFAVIFIFIFAFSMNVLAFGDTISKDETITTTYKFELGEKSVNINYEEYIENKNEQFAYGIMEKSDLIVLGICFLLVIIGFLLTKNNNDKKKSHKQ